jgi:hypothetical protein
MLKWFLRRKVRQFGHHYDYDVGYLHHLLEINTGAFLKFNLINLISGHQRDIPAAPLFAASLRAAAAEDCGPCIQLVSNMALEAGVNSDVVAGILSADFEVLDPEVRLVLQFTERVLARDPEAEPLRAQIRERWGEDALISVGFAISASRVYPTLKYTLGYGEACSRIQIAQQSVVPNRNLAWG